MLCQNCNPFLGHFEDSVLLLERAKAYLLRSLSLQQTAA
jgi:hypothetical protein